MPKEPQNGSPILVRWREFPEQLHDLAGGWRYRAVVDYWYDGDTVIAIDHYGKRLYQQVEYRLLRLNTPEIDAPKNSLEYEAAVAARDYAISLMPQGTFFVAHSVQDRRSFNRYLAEIFYFNGTEIISVNHMIREEQRRTDNWGYGIKNS